MKAVEMNNTKAKGGSATPRRPSPTFLSTPSTLDADLSPKNLLTWMIIHTLFLHMFFLWQLRKEQDEPISFVVYEVKNSRVEKCKNDGGMLMSGPVGLQNFKSVYIGC